MVIVFFGSSLLSILICSDNEQLWRHFRQFSTYHILIYCINPFSPLFSSPLTSYPPRQAISSPPPTSNLPVPMHLQKSFAEAPTIPTTKFRVEPPPRSSRSSHISPASSRHGASYFLARNTPSRRRDTGGFTTFCFGSNYAPPSQTSVDQAYMFSDITHKSPTSKDHSPDLPSS